MLILLQRNTRTNAWFRMTKQAKQRSWSKLICGIHFLTTVAHHNPDSSVVVLQLGQAGWQLVYQIQYRPPLDRKLVQALQ